MVCAGAQLSLVPPLFSPAPSVPGGSDQVPLPHFTIDILYLNVPIFLLRSEAFHISLN